VDILNAHVMQNVLSMANVCYALLIMQEKISCRGVSVKMNYIQAIIPVQDIDISRNFYCNICDQKVLYDFGEKVIFQGRFAIQLQSNINKLLSGNIPSINCTSGNAMLYFESVDFEKIQAKFESLFVQIIHGPKLQSWKQKVMRVYDPDLNIIEIGETAEAIIRRLYKSNMTVEEICEQTQMPQDLVDTVLWGKK
jgi:lactoylglutathione lyase